VTGVDASPVGIANARRKLDASRLTATLRVEGADVLDFPAASFDLVICVGLFDSTGPAVARACVERLQSVMSAGAWAFFLFASDRDFQVLGENPFRLYGFRRDEVESLFANRFRQVWIDRYITTYEGGRIEQNDWLVTLQK
jgi:cyclopropane fatty-acyl-phospholipid synthase-like methyltransferase